MLRGVLALCLFFFLFCLPLLVCRISHSCVILVFNLWNKCTAFRLGVETSSVSIWMKYTICKMNDCLSLSKSVNCIPKLNRIALQIFGATEMKILEQSVICNSKHSHFSSISKAIAEGSKSCSCRNGVCLQIHAFSTLSFVIWRPRFGTVRLPFGCN